MTDRELIKSFRSMEAQYRSSMHLRKHPEKYKPLKIDKNTPLCGIDYGNKNFMDQFKG